MTAESHVRELLAHIDDPERDGLQDTPARVVRALREMTAGYRADIGAILSARFPAEGYAGPVELRDIPFVALCEHHLLPFTGVAHVTYTPRGDVLGLSKLARLVDAFARRLTTQERMTAQIADTLVWHGVASSATVEIHGHHTCMALRGVGKPGATMITRIQRGV